MRLDLRKNTIIDKKQTNIWIFLRRRNDFCIRRLINSNLNLNVEEITKSGGGAVSNDTNTTKTFKTTKPYKILILFVADFSVSYTQEGSSACNKGTLLFNYGYSAGNEEPHSSAHIRVYIDIPSDATITFRYSCLYRYAAYGIA